MTPNPVVYTEQQKEVLSHLKKVVPHQASMAVGQAATSVLFREPAPEPHNYHKALEAGQLLPHPSGKFVRP